MKLHLRETGSVLVRARKDAVVGVLQGAQDAGTLVSPDRFESPGRAFVLRDTPRGTQVFLVREERGAVATASRERAELRRQVQSDLFDLERRLEIGAPLTPGSNDPSRASP